MGKFGDLAQQTRNMSVDVVEKVRQIDTQPCTPWGSTFYFLKTTLYFLEGQLNREFDP